ncbi:hypothetical protein Droror1_Dr00018624 [Drosera rotundifolia]
MENLLIRSPVDCFFADSKHVLDYTINGSACFYPKSLHSSNLHSSLATLHSSLATLTPPHLRFIVGYHENHTGELGISDEANNKQSRKLASRAVSPTNQLTSPVRFSISGH